MLKRHVEGGRLRSAFDAVNADASVRSYDRTSLMRWVAGESTPSDRPFVERLGVALGDPAVLSAWEQDVGVSSGDSEVRDLVSRFRRLNPDRKRAVLRRLVGALFQDDLASRTEFTMRVELHPRLTATCHRLDVGLTWIGHLPANATVQVATDERLLDAAYADEGCIFRELVSLDSATFDDATRQLKGAEPVLRYKPLHESQFVRADGSYEADRPGTYRFVNDDVTSAYIRLNVCLPYPAGLSMYPVMLGSYAIAGRSRVTVLLAGDEFGQPHALPFLGDTAVWGHPGDFDRNELTVEIGDDDSVVEPNSGVVFYWQVEQLAS